VSRGRAKLAEALSEAERGRDRGASSRRNHSSLSQHRALVFTTHAQFKDPEQIKHPECDTSAHAPPFVSSRPEAAEAEGSWRVRAPQPRLFQAATAFTAMLVADSADQSRRPGTTFSSRQERKIAEVD